MWYLLVFPLLRGGHQVIDRLSNLPKVTQLISEDLTLLLVNAHILSSCSYFCIRVPLWLSKKGFMELDQHTYTYTYCYLIGYWACCHLGSYILHTHSSILAEVHFLLFGEGEF